MTFTTKDLDSVSDWFKQISFATRQIRSTTQIWVVTPHQYGISALVSQTSFGGETSGSVAKCRLFSQANSSRLTAMNIIWFVFIVVLYIERFFSRALRF